jgi:NAD(P)-dependent dehydrogenase (short-subunit alcohol dehydrogenase family)
LAEEIGGLAFAVEAGDAAQVMELFAAITQQIGEPDLVLYNASGRVRGALTELDRGEVENAIRVSAFGGFLAGQEAARRFLARKLEQRGTILFTGASLAGCVKSAQRRHHHLPPARRSRRETGAGMSIRVLIVDDSATTRGLIRVTLERDPEIQVVGEAADAAAFRYVGLS